MSVSSEWYRSSLRLRFSGVPGIDIGIEMIVDSDTLESILLLDIVLKRLILGENDDPEKRRVTDFRFVSTFIKPRFKKFASSMPFCASRKLWAKRFVAECDTANCVHNVCVTECDFKFKSFSRRYLFCVQEFRDTLIIQRPTWGQHQKWRWMTSQRQPIKMQNQFYF